MSKIFTPLFQRVHIFNGHFTRIPTYLLITEIVLCEVRTDSKQTLECSKHISLFTRQVCETGSLALHDISTGNTVLNVCDVSTKHTQQCLELPHRLFLIRFPDKNFVHTLMSPQVCYTSRQSPSPCEEHNYEASHYVINITR